MNLRYKSYKYTITDRMNDVGGGGGRMIVNL
jgi:hypothetical protein